MIISQLEIYDRAWYLRHMPEDSDYSKEGTELARETVKSLEEILDGCAESFPFDLIDELKQYFSELP